MPSLVPGFEYDVFISYRQNDNRSGWEIGPYEKGIHEAKQTEKISPELLRDEDERDGDERDADFWLRFQEANEKNG